MSNINTTPFQQRLTQIQDRLNLNRMKQVLMKGANIIKKDAQMRVKKKIGSSGLHHYSNRKGQIRFYSIDRGVRATPYRKNKTYSNDAVVATHIMGDYRLKFFEMGTKIRSTKQGYDRGRIKKERFHFFDVSVRSKSRAAYNAIRNEFEKMIK